MFKNLTNLLKRPDRQSTALHKNIFTITGFIPVNIDLYRCALTHRSHGSSLRRKKSFNNERLEYLGDAILSAVIADYLYTVYPSGREGILTKMRARLVNRRNLNSIAVKMGFDKLVVLSENSIPTRKHIYGNALEAFIGASFIDKGYDTTKKFIVKKIIGGFSGSFQEEYDDHDYKSRIIQWGQKNRKDISFESHEITEEESRNPQFIATIHIMNVPAGEGLGGTKKEAQQLAAREALLNLPASGGVRPAKQVSN